MGLAGRVSRARGQFKISVGDGGNEALLRRIRAHGQSVETMPIVLILLGLLELAGGDRRILWAAGIAFILARILHAFGMDRPSPSRLRVVGMVGSALVLLGRAGWALSNAYRQPVEPRTEIQIGPGRSADWPEAPRG